ncbi:MAG: DUF935 family protein, partial [Desulfobacteraceae bacterium]|nr:DUF935 family protein [Desulfobacteraceae bacterium]
MLFDQFGRKIDYSRIKKADTRVIPVVALEDRYSGYPSSGLTPRKLGRIFREADSGDTAGQAELFSEMEEKDTHLFSQLLVKKQSVQALEWEVEASEKNGKAKETARAVRDFLESYANSDEVVLDLMDAVAKGYSMCQIIWDNSEKQTSVLDIKWVRADRVTFWNSLTPRVLTVDEPVQGIDLPPYKFI